MIPELESGKLTVDLPEHGLRTGDVGVVVLVHVETEQLRQVPADAGGEDDPAVRFLHAAR